MPKTKDGERIDWKEFFRRWGEGIKEITPKQKLKTQLLGTRISIVGLLLGLGVSIYAWEKMWWVGIVLIGAIINMSVQYLGFKQQLNQFNKMDQYEEVELDDVLNEEEVK